MSTKPAPVTSLVSFELRRAAPGMFTMGSRSAVDSHNLNAQLVTQADLEQLRDLIDQMLPRTACPAQPRGVST